MSFLTFHHKSDKQTTHIAEEEENQCHQKKNIKLIKHICLSRNKQYGGDLHLICLTEKNQKEKNIGQHFHSFGIFYFYFLK